MRGPSSSDSTHRSSLGNRPSGEYAGGGGDAEHGDADELVVGADVEAVGVAAAG